MISTVLSWCGVDPASAGLGDRVAAAPSFDSVLADEPRSDVPTFTLPDGYAEQGKDCWVTNENEGLPVGVMRGLVARSATVADLEAQMKAALGES